jgi:hypothetical protein
MKALRKTVQDHDVVDWAAQFMGRLDKVKPAHGKRLRGVSG